MFEIVKLFRSLKFFLLDDQFQSTSHDHLLAPEQHLQHDKKSYVYFLHEKQFPKKSGLNKNITQQNIKISLYHTFVNISALLLKNPLANQGQDITKI
jgi:hypothetical protein